MKRVLALAFDGADYDLVRRLMGEGKLPTISRLAREGAFGPLRSTIPAFTPTAWSSFLTGLNPAGHGIFNFTTNPNRGTQKLESAASRAGTPLWRMLGPAGIRSAYIGIPFTYPAEPLDGIVVTGYGGPERPQILPASAEERIFAAYPDLVTAHHPMAERWWEDFPAYTGRLLEHAEQMAGVCKLVFELEPDLGLLCVDFMSTDHVGHLGYARFDPEHPAHASTGAGDELLQVYERVDALCGELIEAAEAQYGEEPTVLLFSDHGMKPIYWMFHLDRWLEERGHLRFRKRSLQPLAAPPARLVRARRPEARADACRGTAARSTLLPFLPRPARRSPLRRHRLRHDARLRLRLAGAALPRRAHRRAERPGLHRRARGRARRDPAPADGRARLPSAAQGGALPRAVPRQGARAHAHPVRRADQRRSRPAAAGRRPSSGTSGSIPRSRTATRAITA